MLADPEEGAHDAEAGVDEHAGLGSSQEKVVQGEGRGGEVVMKGTNLKIVFIHLASLPAYGFISDLYHPDADCQRGHSVENQFCDRCHSHCRVPEDLVRDQNEEDDQGDHRGDEHKDPAEEAGVGAAAVDRVLVADVDGCLSLGTLIIIYPF